MDSNAADGDTPNRELTGLRVDFDREPENVDPLYRPRFSWRIEHPDPDPDRGGKQIAYRIRVARDLETLESGAGGAGGAGLCWDSGKVTSDRSAGIRYDGTDLRPDESYYWTVRVWDTTGEYSETSQFTTALATGADWDGEWVGYQPGEGDTNGFRTRWHSIDDDGHEWVQVDLGTTRAISAIELHPAAPFDGPTAPDGTTVTPLYSHSNPDGPREQLDRAHGFGFPEGYRIEVAADPSFETSHVVADVREEDGENPGTAPVVHGTDVDGRYVRVTMTSLYEFEPTSPPHLPRSARNPEMVTEEMRPWQMAALAALAVRDEYGTDVAVDRPVSSSSSVETDTWGREQLVNGKYDSTTAPGSPLLRTAVDLSKPVASARIHVASLGYGELYVNGERIGDAVVDPSWTAYDERILYTTHDVGDVLHAGKNALGLWLGRGRFSRGNRDWPGFGSPRAICQLHIVYEDGSTRRVSTDTTWSATESPIRANDLYDGETYDARREKDGWASPEYEADWEAAAHMESPGGDLKPQRTDPISVVDTLEPTSITTVDDGFVVDFGQNVTGWVKLRLTDPVEGEPVDVRHAEALDEDGDLSTIDLRSADATDTYIPRGEPTERYQPRFTYHGFRYARVDGYPGELTSEDIHACVVSTALDERGTFDCSDPEVNRIQSNAWWGLRGTTHGIPEDCPQRDERFGWTGDGHITAQSLLYNFDAVRFHRKWMDDHDDAQSNGGYVADTVPAGFGNTPADPTWSITRVVIPWYLYQHSGDPSVLERSFEGMRRYVDFWHSVAEDYLIPARYGSYGDWLAFENTDGRSGKPFELFNTAFHYQTTRTVARAAAVLEFDALSSTYHDRATAIAEAFTEAFFDAESATYGPGTQSSSAVPLFLGLVPDDHEEAVAEQLATTVRDDGGKLRSGFLGTRPLILTLAKHGYPELAYQVVTQPERPGWLYMVRNGATTMWERWDSDEKVGSGMNSLNHSPFTFVSEWFYRVLAGIELGTGSVRDRLRIEPSVVDDLEWVEGRLDIPQGELASRWKRTGDGLELTVTIPWNASARVSIPRSGIDTVRLRDGETVIWENGERMTLPAGVTAITRGEDSLFVDVDAGTYRFVREDDV